MQMTQQFAAVSKKKKKSSVRADKFNLGAVLEKVVQSVVA